MHAPHLRASAALQEYVKGVSCWNFDVAALKAQAALEPDDSVPNTPLAPALPTIAEEGPDVTLGASSSADFKQVRGGGRAGGWLVLGAGGRAGTGLGQAGWQGCCCEHWQSAWQVAVQHKDAAVAE
jgi:serine/threonine-protein kinase OSR1/STK39